MATNAQIMAAIVNKVAQPIVMAYMNELLGANGFVQMLENKVKNMGIVSPQWRIINELAPFGEVISGAMVVPFLTSLMQGVDEQLPMLARDFIRKAKEQGSISLLEGKIILDKHDINEMERLIENNLPPMAEMVELV
jgi:hypothetical protein